MTHYLGHGKRQVQYMASKVTRSTSRRGRCKAILVTTNENLVQSMERNNNETATRDVKL